MKKLLIGMALGATAGLLVGGMPKVKSAVDKGKKKVKELTK